MAKGWYGVDLDGTLAEYDHWRGVDHIGAIIPAMRDRILYWLKQGHEVRIVTSRIAAEDHNPTERGHARYQIQLWLQRNSLPPLVVTDRKGSRMISLFDDRVTRVEPNTGEICPGCKEHLLH